MILNAMKAALLAGVAAIFAAVPVQNATAQDYEYYHNDSRDYWNRYWNWYDNDYRNYYQRRYRYDRDDYRRRGYYYDRDQRRSYYRDRDYRDRDYDNRYRYYDGRYRNRPDIGVGVGPFRFQYWK